MGASLNQSFEEEASDADWNEGGVLGGGIIAALASSGYCTAAACLAAAWINQLLRMHEVRMRSLDLCFRI